MNTLGPTDKRKTSLDILIDAQMDIRSLFPSPLEPERVLQEVLHWYKISERHLYQLRYIKVKRLYMFLLQEVSSLDYVQIAKLTKCRTEIEVIDGIDKIKAAMRKDQVLLANAKGIVDLHLLIGTKS